MAARQDQKRIVRSLPQPLLVKTAQAPAGPELQKKIGRLQVRLGAAYARIAELEARADTDFLLDILNRRGFERELRRSIAYLKRYKATAALIYLDVDGLKPINDTYGHAAGDAYLKALARLLVGSVRLSDTVARLGGDEFALLLWNLTPQDAQAKATALEQAIGALVVPFNDATLGAGVSAGIAMVEPLDDPGAVLERADRAMYARKTERRCEREPVRG